MSTQVADISDKIIAPPSECIICTEGLWKTYQMGQEQVHALRGVNLRSIAASTSPSWAPPAPANPRS